MNRSVHAVYLVIKPTGIADNAGAISDSSPQCSLCGATVAAACVSALVCAHAGGVHRVLHQRPVGAVHLVVEATCVTQVVTRAVSSPQRGAVHTTVDTLPAGGGGGGGAGGGHGGGDWRQ